MSSKRYIHAVINCRYIYTLFNKRIDEYRIMKTTNGGPGITSDLPIKFFDQ